MQWQGPLLLLLILQPSSAEFTVVIPDTSEPPRTGLTSGGGERTDPDEQLAVYEIMAAAGNPWAASISDVCRCRWHGIECALDRVDGFNHVVSLSFGALSDDTAFPSCAAALSPAVLRLPRLRSLFFYRCFQASPGPIPSFLGRLGPALSSLVLRHCHRAGPIPPELGNLTSLRALDLHGNRLNSSIPSSFSRLVNLRLLDLSHNHLSGALPDLNSPSLSILDLNHNSLRSRIPPSLSKCGSLIKIDLSRNRFVGSIPNSLQRIESLMLLDLSHNSLIGGLPCARLKNGYRSLRALVLEGNLMRGSAIPERCFAGMKEMNALVLSGMGLEGAIPESMGGEMRELRVLRMNGNMLSGAIPESFERLQKLSELWLDGNRLRGRIPFGRETIRRMGRKLRVSNNSGLCFGKENGGMVKSTALTGIGYCNATAKHFSLWKDEGPSSAGIPASGGAIRPLLLLGSAVLCLLKV